MVIFRVSKVRTTQIKRNNNLLIILNDLLMKCLDLLYNKGIRGDREFYYFYGTFFLTKYYIN